MTKELCGSFSCYIFVNKITKFLKTSKPKSQVITFYPLKLSRRSSVYTDYRTPFLNTIEGALTKELLIRDEDVQVLHGFDTLKHAAAYLNSELFNADVVKGLKPLWSAEPDVKIYTVA